MKTIIDRSQIKKHIESLGISDTQDYYNWCVDNGFNPHLNKNENQRKKELTRHKYSNFDDSLKVKNSKGLSDYIPTEHVDDEMLEYFDFISKKSKMVSNTHRVYKGLMYNDALLCLWSYKGWWIRDYKDWNPRSKNPMKQLSSLIRFLLTDYDIPLFADKAWFIKPLLRSKTLEYHDDITTNLKWYLGLCQGQNIRTMNKLPIPLTKKQAHHFCKAPETYSYSEAFRYGQILGLGGNKRLIEQVINKLPLNCTGHHYKWDEKVQKPNQFHDPLIRLFIANPMLDVHMFGQIIDYVTDQRYENPNFSYKGKTAESLLRKTEEWHERVRKTEGKNFRNWEPNKDIGIHRWEEGNVENKNFRVWTITELVNSKQLASEGKQLKHCVRSYVRSCGAGRVSIWSLSCNDEKKVTVEVNNKMHKIVQAKGLANRSPNSQEMRNIREWAINNSIDLGSRL